jgi:hypothetical protein
MFIEKMYVLVAQNELCFMNTGASEHPAMKLPDSYSQ